MASDPNVIHEPLLIEDADIELRVAELENRVASIEEYVASKTTAGPSATTATTAADPTSDDPYAHLALANAERSDEGELAEWEDVGGEGEPGDDA